MGLKSASLAVLGWVWPQICAHCRRRVADSQAPLCAGCRGLLTKAVPPFCQRCADPLYPDQPYCPRCRAARPACRMIRAAFRYGGPAASLVHAFKYRGRRPACAAAGLWMAHCFARYPELGWPDAVAAVPLHRRRLRLRGYNQAWLIAEAFSRALELPLLDVLARPRATRQQWTLGRRQRQDNLEGVIAYNGAPGQVKGLRMLLIDDVCTSGASLEACAKALREAGAGPVDGFVFARQGALPT